MAKKKIFKNDKSVLENFYVHIVLKFSTDYATTDHHVVFCKY